jgi:radical SAM protein with 4Fe4S-binding SPASM domain
MKYICRPRIEQAEGAYLPASFGKTYDPFGSVTIPDEARLNGDGIDLVELDGETLAIHPESASWAFLSASELNLYRQALNHNFRWLKQNWPTDAPSAAGNFVAHLYRRGLLTINGHTAVDRTMFADSPNYNEGHLVELLVTEKCNLACPYCLAGADKSMPTMNHDIGIRAVDMAFRMREAETLAFEFAGGEPFLQFKLMRELVDYILHHPLRDNRKVFLSVQTNATLLTDEHVKWLKNHDIRVGISVDGKPQAQNLSRPQVNGGESYPGLIRGIEILQRHNVNFGALVVLNRYNVGSVTDLVDFLLDHSIYGFRLNPVVYLGTARQNWDSVGLTQDEVIWYFKDFIHLVADRGYILLEDNIRTMCEFLTSKQRRTRCMRSHCGAGDTFQSVAANGDIYPCGRATQSPGLKMGNICDSGLISLSTAADHNPIIKQIRERRPHTLEGCETCHYRQLCQAGCSAQAYERYKTVRHRTPECDFYKTLYPYLMRWLSFDQCAFDAFNRSHYFAGEGIRFDYDFTVPTRATCEIWPPMAVLV